MQVTQQEAPVPVQQSPTLSLQLNRGNTQHTVAEQPLEETQENEAEIAEAGRVSIVALYGVLYAAVQCKCGKL